MAHYPSSDPSTPRAEQLDARARRALLVVAREAVARGVGGEGVWEPDEVAYPPALWEPRACFVTLHLAGRLRGCVGSLAARHPLVRETARSARGAALSDPRFSAVNERELGGLHYHISVLTPAVPLSFESQRDLLGQLRPGIDGLILRDGRHSGTFLPAVWEMFPDPLDFLRQLRLKAGLSIDHWSSTLTIARYAADSFDEA